MYPWTLEQVWHTDIMDSRHWLFCGVMVHFETVKIIARLIFRNSLDTHIGHVNPNILISYIKLQVMVGHYDNQDWVRTQIFLGSICPQRCGYGMTQTSSLVTASIVFRLAFPLPSAVLYQRFENDSANIWQQKQPYPNKHSKRSDDDQCTAVRKPQSFKICAEVSVKIPPWAYREKILLRAWLEVAPRTCAVQVLIGHCQLVHCR